MCDKSATGTYYRLDVSNNFLAIEYADDYDCYDNRIYVGVEKLSVDSLREISDNGVSG